MTYRIAETETFRKEITKSQYRGVYKKLLDYVYPMLRENPFFGPNIKRLKGDYSSFYRFRVGRYRVFYQVFKENITVYIVSIEHRKDAYR